LSSDLVKELGKLDDFLGLRVRCSYPSFDVGPCGRALAGFDTADLGLRHAKTAGQLFARQTGSQA